MQAENYEKLLLFWSMKKNTERSEYGAYLTQLRREAGLTQTELAQKLGVPQSNITYWEKADRPPRSDVLEPLAKALRVTIEDLLQIKTIKPQRPPVRGKLAKVFNKASALPRRQQEKIADVVDALVARTSNG